MVVVLLEVDVDVLVDVDVDELVLLEVEVLVLLEVVLLVDVDELVLVVVLLLVLVDVVLLVEVDVVVVVGKPARSCRTFMMRPTMRPNIVVPVARRIFAVGAHTWTLTAAARPTRTEPDTNTFTSRPKAPPVLVTVPEPSRRSPATCTVVGPRKSICAPRIMRMSQNV